jgi:hypothetical protein
LRDIHGGIVPLEQPETLFLGEEVPDLPGERGKAQELPRPIPLDEIAKAPAFEVGSQ